MVARNGLGASLRTSSRESAVEKSFFKKRQSRYSRVQPRIVSSLIVNYSGHLSTFNRLVSGSDSNPDQGLRRLGVSLSADDSLPGA